MVRSRTNGREPRYVAQVWLSHDDVHIDTMTKLLPSPPSWETKTCIHSWLFFNLQINQISLRAQDNPRWHYRFYRDAMADFAPPQGPPPPKVPEGWTARWDANYSEWFYVNTYTKRSQVCPAQ